MCSLLHYLHTQCCQIWDVKTGILKQEMDCGGYVYSVCFADHHVVATGDQHKNARLWDSVSGQFAHTSHDLLRL